MRRAKTIYEKIQQCERILSEVKKTVSENEYEKATVYTRATITALKWVLGDLKHV